jgi:hypothetical protein
VDFRIASCLAMTAGLLPASSSLRGAQRRSNPESRGFPDCFVPRNDGGRTGIETVIKLNR